MDTSKVTRVEIIDHTKSFEEGGGRTYTKWHPDIKVEVVLQDKDRNLKIFITKNENNINPR